MISLFFPAGKTRELCLCWAGWLLQQCCFFHEIMIWQTSMLSLLTTFWDTLYIYIYIYVCVCVYPQNIHLTKKHFKIRLIFLKFTSNIEFFSRLNLFFLSLNNMTKKAILNILKICLKGAESKAKTLSYIKNQNLQNSFSLVFSPRKYPLKLKRIWGVLNMKGGKD